MLARVLSPVTWFSDQVGRVPLLGRFLDHVLAGWQFRVPLAVICVASFGMLAGADLHYLSVPQ